MGADEVFQDIANQVSAILKLTTILLSDISFDTLLISFFSFPMSTLVAASAIPGNGFYSIDHPFALISSDSDISMIEMSDEELEEINGSVGPLAIYGIRIGVGTAAGAVAGGVTSAINGKFSWRAVGAGAVAGAISGATGAWFKVRGF